MLEHSDVQRALVITAHPDDVDFGAAGTVANMTSAGVDVAYCLVTDGDAGGFDQNIPRPQMAMMRREEQKLAAKEVGVEQLIFLGFGDGRVEYNLTLRAALTRVIRHVRPQRVITQSPTLDLTRIYAGHPDHVATGQATIAAVYPDSRNPFAHPELLAEGLATWTVPEVWVMSNPGPGDANVHVEDVTDSVDRKIRALMHTRPSTPIRRAPSSGCGPGCRRRLSVSSLPKGGLRRHTKWSTRADRMGSSRLPVGRISPFSRDNRSRFFQPITKIEGSPCQKPSSSPQPAVRSAVPTRERSPRSGPTKWRPRSSGR